MREIAEHGTESVGILRGFNSIPKNAAFGCLGDGCENAHERCLAGSVWAKQAKDTGLYGQAEIVKGAMTASVLLADIFDDKFQCDSERSSSRLNVFQGSKVPSSNLKAL